MKTKICFIPTCRDSTDCGQITCTGEGEDFLQAAGQLMVEVAKLYSGERCYAGALMDCLSELADEKGEAFYFDFSVPEDAFKLTIEETK